MDLSSHRPNRSAQSAPQAHAQPQPAAGPSQAARAVAPKKKRAPKKRIITIIILVVALAALIAGGIFAYQQFGPSLVKRDKYQAVFLTNGQVYFGKLHTSGDYYKLSDVYYLQTTDTSTSGNPQKTAESGSGVQLIKLGQEVHGPEDEMVIQRSQVLFFENLRDDGTVVDSINSYKKDNQ